jgi:hypothetical protein
MKYAELVFAVIGVVCVASAVLFTVGAWLSALLDKDLTGLDFDSHARDAIELGDGTR